jgi:hypothetical protein
VTEKEYQTLRVDAAIHGTAFVHGPSGKRIPPSEMMTFQGMLGYAHAREKQAQMNRLVADHMYQHARNLALAPRTYK